MRRGSIPPASVYLPRHAGPPQSLGPRQLAHGRVRAGRGDAGELHLVGAARSLDRRANQPRADQRARVRRRRRQRPGGDGARGGARRIGARRRHRRLRLRHGGGPAAAPRQPRRAVPDGRRGLPDGSGGAALRGSTAPSSSSAMSATPSRSGWRRRAPRSASYPSTSTTTPRPGDSLAILEGDSTHLMPRILCYFDDTHGYPWGDFNGARLAIEEYNAAGTDRKLAQLHGLRYLLPLAERDAALAGRDVRRPRLRPPRLRGARGDRAGPPARPRSRRGGRLMALLRRRARRRSDGADALAEIERLTEANRAAPDPEVEARLVKLRNQAFAALGDNGNGAGFVEPAAIAAGDDPDDDGVPSVAAADLTAPIIRGAFLSHGCLIVRGLVEPGRAAELQADIDRVFAARDEAVDAERESAPPWYQPFEPVEEEYARLGQDRPRLRRQGLGRSGPPTPRGCSSQLLETFDAAGMREIDHRVPRRAAGDLGQQGDAAPRRAEGRDRVVAPGRRVPRRRDPLAQHLALADPFGSRRARARGRSQAARRDRRQGDRGRRLRLVRRRVGRRAGLRRGAVAPDLRARRRDALRPPLPAPDRHDAGDDEDPLRDRDLVLRALRLPGPAGAGPARLLSA